MSKLILANLRSVGSQAPIPIPDGYWRLRKLVYVIPGYTLSGSSDWAPIQAWLTGVDYGQSSYQWGDVSWGFQSFPLTQWNSDSTTRKAVYYGRVDLAPSEDEPVWLVRKLNVESSGQSGPQIMVTAILQDVPTGSLSGAVKNWLKTRDMRVGEMFQ